MHFIFSFLPSEAPQAKQGGSRGLQKRGFAQRAAEAKAVADARSQPLWVMFQDEARFGRINSPRACWAPKSIRPMVRKQMVREYTHVFGAVSPKDGVHDSLVLPNADTKTMSCFLGKVSKRHPEEHILMLMDRARWHTSKTLRVLGNMESGFLPSHSPELNPEEQVWGELREKFFGNRLFNSMEEVEGAAAKPSCIISLLHTEIMLHAKVFETTSTAGHVRVKARIFKNLRAAMPAALSQVAAKCNLI